MSCNQKLHFLAEFELKVQSFHFSVIWVNGGIRIWIGGSRGLNREKCSSQCSSFHEVLPSTEAWFGGGSQRVGGEKLGAEFVSSAQVDPFGRGAGPVGSFIDVGVKQSFGREGDPRYCWGRKSMKIHFFGTMEAVTKQRVYQIFVW